MGSSSASSSSSSTSLKDYQVFLSFRGEDTRKTFLSHLYAALTHYGIRTFKDDKKLDKGDSLTAELLGAIKQSQIAIVVLSEKYAFSSWCLVELAQIMRCREMSGQQVIPVFYEVDPSDVRKQKGSFKKAFTKHKKTIKKDELQKWQQILAEVASLSGWDSRNWNDDAELIKSIIADVSDRLFPTSSTDCLNLVGMDTHMKELERLLCLESEHVKMIGLWGMGGIGKTTIARCFYDQTRKRFEHCCFLENVKEMFRKLNQNMVTLQEQFLSELFRERDLKLWDAGSNVIKERLCCKRVLVVLDDVDKISQIHFFARECEWFGPGSRIIITTRDKKLLHDHGVQDVYEVTLLEKTNALELFSKYAFKQDSPKEDFNELSIEVIRYAGGLPLALKVLGSMLLNRSKSMWLDTLEKLSDVSVKDISEVLRVSYDGLDSNERDIFFYIACLFKGMYQSGIRSILKACGLKPDLGMTILIEKSLITCDDKLRIQVHDLLQDMARDIIRQDSPAEPWKHKMVLNPEDIDELFNAFDECNEMIKAEAIFIDMSRKMELCLNPMAFRRMHNLKFLKICNNYLAGQGKVQLLSDLDYLPKKLVYLFWDNFPLRSLPSRFYPQNLVELHLRRNDSLEKLWDGTQPVTNLRVMDLSKCSKLIEVPDLSMATRLERLNLSYNHSLERLWDGAQPLMNLRLMNLSKCSKLIEVPDLSKATRLEQLILSCCGNLSEVPYSIGNLHNLYNLDLYGCRKLKKLPSGINLKSLKLLNLSFCSRLSEFPCVSENVRGIYLRDTAIEEVPPSVKHLSQLETLHMPFCNRLRYISNEIQNLDSLNFLNLSSCPSLTEFPGVGKNIASLVLDATAIEEVPPSIMHASRLLHLDISKHKRPKKLPTITLDLSYCPTITKFPEIGKNVIILCLAATPIEEVPPSIKHLSQLAWLNMSNCKRLKDLPSEIQKLDSLHILRLSDCPGITKFPEVGKNIKEIYLKATAIEEVPPSIKHLSQLKGLVLSECKGLKNLPGEIQDLDSLEELVLSNCPGITKFPKVGKNIKRLYLEATAVEEVPPSIKHLSQLLCLDMPNCMRLKNLPSEIHNLDSLIVLNLSNCPNITEFPDVGKAIQTLKLDGTAIEEVPSWIGNRRKLFELSLRGCSKITKFPEISQYLTYLCVHGTGIREVCNEAIRRRGRDQVICGEYDSNGTWIAPPGTTLSSHCLLLASAVDHIQGVSRLKE